MVTVAADHGRQVVKPLVRRGHHARLVDHQHAHAVARIEEFRRRWIVRGAHGIAAHVLQALQAIVPQGVGHGGADPGMVLVIAGALDLDALAVEEEAGVRIEPDVAQAERRKHTIERRVFGDIVLHDLVIGDRGLKPIGIGIFQRP